MFTLFKIGVITISILIILALVSPLIIFFTEIITNPEKSPQLRIEQIGYTEDQQYITLKIELIYNGTIPLTDFEITLLGKELYFGVVEKGIYEKYINVSISSIQELLREINMYFKIAGIYPVEVRVKGGTS